MPGNDCCANGITEDLALASAADAAGPRLPSFFIIGPPRTGTTWLHSLLSECAWLPHPTKETRFFDQHYERGLGWYSAHYRKATAARKIGEVAPTYFISAPALDCVGAAAKKWGGMNFFVGGGPSFSELSSVQRTRLRELFRPDIDSLEVMLNRDLSAW